MLLSFASTLQRPCLSLPVVPVPDVSFLDYSDEKSFNLVVRRDVLSQALEALTANPNQPSSLLTHKPHQTFLPCPCVPPRVCESCPLLEVWRFGRGAPLLAMTVDRHPFLKLTQFFRDQGGLVCIKTL